MNYNMNRFDRPFLELVRMLRTIKQNLYKENGRAIMMVQEGNGNKQYTSGDKGKGKGKNEFKRCTIDLKLTGGVVKDDTCFHCSKTSHWKRNCHNYLEER